VINYDGKIVAHSFKRFFNINQYENQTKQITRKIEETVIFEKKDGSIMLVFHHNDDWVIISRGSFADDMAFNDKSLKELFLENFNDFDKLDKTKSYAFELCTSDNRIITSYESDHISLLMVRCTNTMNELQFDEIEKISREIGVSLPNLYKADSIEKMYELLEIEGKKNKTYEGFVMTLYDGVNDPKRIKIKRELYLMLHHGMFTSFVNFKKIAKSGSEKKNLPKSIVTLFETIISVIFKNEMDEIMAYESFHDYMELVEDIRKVLDTTKAAFIKFYETIDYDKITKKELAMRLNKGMPKDICYYKPIFFKIADGKYDMKNFDDDWMTYTKNHVSTIQQNQNEIFTL
jgi:hypothetical protein